jgi:hypothetical protein
MKMKLLLLGFIFSFVFLRATGVVTGLSGGIASVTYTTGLGCTTNKFVIVNPIAPITGTTAICAEASTTLSDAASGGNWSSPGYGGIVSVGLTTGNVTGLSAGTAIITYQTPLGCVATIPVTVNPVPSAGVISGAGIVCAGAAITLSDAATGGIWSSSNTLAVVSGGVVSGISAGVSTISYTVANGCSAAFALHTVAIYVLPAIGPVTGAASVCVGRGITLSDTTAGGVWSTTGVGVSVGPVTGVVTGIFAGTATITYTMTGICGAAEATYTLTINPLPAIGTITGAPDVCVGATTSLTDAVSGGTWISSNTHATVSGRLVVGVTGVSAGLDTIIYITTNSCGSATALHYMTINPLPDAGLITGAGNVCAGAAAALSDAATGGVWSGSGSASVGSATGMVTGISAGTTTITYTVVSICGTGISTHTMTVNPQPFAGTISGTNNVCVGQTTTLTDNIPGGIWATINNATDTVYNGAVSGLSAGADTIKYSVTNMCGIAVAAYAITVNPLPDAGTITGPLEVCVGATINLSDGISGGLLLTNNSNVAIGAGGLIEGLSAGAAVITYNVSNMCGGSNAMITINVIALPTAGAVTGKANECVGMSTALTDTANGGMWYSHSNNILGVGSATGIVTGISAGTDTVFYTVSNSCGTEKASKLIAIDPLPDAGTIAGNDSVCAGDTISLSGSVAGGVWGNTNNHSAGLQQKAGGAIQIAGLSPGADTVTYSITNSCGIATVLHVITVRPASDCNGNAPKVDSEFSCSGNGEVMIYPNPNLGTFTFNVTSTVQEEVSIVIVNMLGQRLKILTTITNTPLTIVLNEPPGIYVVTMISAQGKCRKKMVIER